MTPWLADIAARRLQQLSLFADPAPAEDGETHRKETDQSAP